jgi:hypothetical protein
MVTLTDGIYYRSIWQLIVNTVAKQFLSWTGTGIGQPKVLNGNQMVQFKESPTAEPSKTNQHAARF